MKQTVRVEMIYLFFFFFKQSCTNSQGYELREEACHDRAHATTNKATCLNRKKEERNADVCPDTGACQDSACSGI